MLEDMALARGSSPLARGLQAQPARGRAQDRIIPARAGFTAVDPVAVLSSGDHPRSRGVYLAFCWDNCVSAGSSPLARGLLERGGERLDVNGIIPARAGFTRTAKVKTP